MLASIPARASVDWQGVDRTLGRSGAVQAGGVHRYGFPRSDLHVVLDGITLKPALALGSWAAFRETGDQTEVMGDLVLTHEEVNPVLSLLLANGMTITALHNHLLRSSPSTMYMHIHGHGDAIKLAIGLRRALAASGTPMVSAPAATLAPAMDTASLDRGLRGEGHVTGGVIAYGFPRAEQVTDGGMALPPTMGLATAINIQPTSPGRAVATGDFVLVASEIDPVLKALRDSGIEVTALHHHLAGEQPRLFFMHFWGNGSTQKLTAGLAAALDKMNLKRSR
jgi:hypothetical protein